MEFCPCKPQRRPPAVHRFHFSAWAFDGEPAPVGIECSSQSPRRCSHFPADLCLRPCASQFIPVTSPQGDFLFGGLSLVVQPLFAQCNSNTSSPETCHEAYLARPERLATDSFICLETGQSILSVTFFFFLNVNFMFTLVPASRHIKLFLVPSSARVTQAR